MSKAKKIQPKYRILIVDVRWVKDTDELISLMVREMKKRDIGLLERSKLEEEIIGLELKDAIEVCKHWGDLIV